MNRTEQLMANLNGKAEPPPPKSMVIHQDRPIALSNPTRIDVDHLVDAAQMRIEQTLQQIERIVGKAGAELEINNDLVFQRTADGTEVVTMKRQLRFTKDPT